MVAGEKDAEKYRKEMLEERRKSLAGRNKESARHAKVMQELRALSIEQETESFMLKFAAQDDAKAYLAKLAEERRQSLELRGKEAQIVALVTKGAGAKADLAGEGPILA